MADAPNCGAREKSAIPVGMTIKEKENPRTQAEACATGTLS
jgi:hypothetical protein